MGVVGVRGLATEYPMLRPSPAAESKWRKMNILNYKVIFMQRTRYSISNCDLLKGHNFCKEVQLWLLAAGTKQLNYTTS
jgi:hypothetical protein